ncbi:Ldh family oxidoreductase [Streptomyces sp. LHD-70]|uniref:Ldh family oxidoreductase n=1 Tax=Streptomyces sp. LHD-70 TaxID=3072140 RepID=UPI00280D160D|nr:Ldh family oxidoreductase [Streptomyces sp. LHD-70]MDQ8708071.1 Ldh family oxidoreductase [Streptomyces sp. LHD-70]
MTEFDWDQLASLCTSAVTAAGGDTATATALTDAVLAAERRGNAAVGVAHFFDYLDALRDGRLNGSPRPVVSNDHRAVVQVSADDGIAQLAFRKARPLLADAARECGVAVISLSDSYPVGELGYYTSALAEDGLVALAGANSTALMSLYNAPAALTGTNPHSFALPGKPPRLVDQASSTVAWVRIREAAAAGEPIPEGWALDADGNPTTDAAAALLGPVLPFGGVKGSNLAMAVELLSVLSGALFSMDSPDFAAGDQPPRVGMFLLALDPAAFAPDYLDRVEQHLERLRLAYGIDFGRYYASVERPVLPEDLHARLVAAASAREGA